MTARLLAFFLMLPALSAALEIPLQKGEGKSRRGGLVLGFVDMDRIYQEFPETRKARQEYEAQAAKIKSTLADEEASLADLREQLSILRAASAAPAASTAAVAGSTTSVQASTAPVQPALGASLGEKERLLMEQEEQFAADKKDAAQALSDYERKRAEQIFGKLYKSLVQLAEEKGVDLVLDKQGLLYGEAGLDLTEALSRRVRGLPDAEDQ